MVFKGGFFLPRASRSFSCFARVALYRADPANPPALPAKLRYFAITEFNNGFIISSPNLFPYLNHSLRSQGSVLPPPPPGGWVLPIMAYTGRLRPKGVPFSGFRYMKRVGISQVEIYKRVGKSVVLQRELNK